MKEELDNLILEIASMIESGTIKVGALGLSRDSAYFVVGYDSSRSDLAEQIETLLQNTNIDKNTRYALMGLVERYVSKKC